MGIKRRADSDFHKFSALNKHDFGRTVNRFELSNVSYTHPLGTSIKRTNWKKNE